MVKETRRSREGRHSAPPPWLVSTAPLNLRGYLLGGALVIGLFFGGLGTWAAFAPLESAAIAPGVVGVDSRRKLVQHLEGGLVRQILVREGDRVAAGQALIVLDETQIRAELERVTTRHTAAVAQRSRLLAQRDGKASISFPQWLLSSAEVDSDVADILEGQRDVFAAQRRSIASQQAILKQRILRYQEEITGIAGQIEAESRQLALIQLETQGVKTLVDKGLAPKPKLYALQRKWAEIEGSQTHNSALIARARQQIAEMKLRMIGLDTSLRDQVVRELGEIETTIYDLEEQLRAAEDILRRTVVRAPNSGTVVNLQVFTKGRVLAPGESLLEVVPSGDSLVIEARVDPMDIDVVHSGLRAQVRLTAFPSRNTPTLEGQVIHVSADRLLDPQSGEAYFGVKVVLDQTEKGVAAMTLYPGMPAEVMILTGRSTALEYLLEPITRTLSQAMREM
jgi:HlyD family type I secretion membrane fusion protein